jgi:hypothetical protein
MRKSIPSGVLARMPLKLEQLETRCLLSIAAPTAVEQLLLEQLNDARANPTAYGKSIGLDLSDVVPSQPLAFDPRLIDAARNHSIDMNLRGYFDHNTPSGITPEQRMRAAGFPVYSSGESIAAGSSFSVTSTVLSALIIDEGIPNLGHRRQLLAIDPLAATHNAVGIGAVLNSTGEWTNYITIDTASSTISLPYITGVVYSDTNKNGAYDIGEGLGNVTITIPGVGSVQTWDTGGYSLQVAPGIYDVTASGGGLTAPITNHIQVGSQNFRMNYVASAVPPTPDPFVPKIYQTVLGRTPTDSDLTYWNTMLQRGMGHAFVATAVENSPEAMGIRVKDWYQTYLGRAAGDQDITWWVFQLTNGLPETAVQATILGSAEYNLRALNNSTTNSTGSQAFIGSLYKQVLDRTASNSDLSFWMANLLVNSSATVANSILNSTEARSIAVQEYYHTILGRSTDATPGEVDFWARSVLSLAQIRVLFESSAEFS